MSDILLDYCAGHSFRSKIIIVTYMSIAIKKRISSILAGAFLTLCTPLTLPAQLTQVGKQNDSLGQRRDEIRRPEADRSRGENYGSKSSEPRRENEALQRLHNPSQYERHGESASERLRRESYESQKQPEPLRESKPVGLTACVEGYVRREAVPGDSVCVTPEVRAQVLRDNNQALDRRDPKGARGPNTCVEGYVWRESTPRDQVCVTPETRAQAQRDNSEAVNRTAR
jgi:hypothetical protein